MSQLTAIVLAAGQGKRMKSALPKVLHPIAGRPLLHFSVAAALQAGAERARLVVSPAGQQAVRTKLEEAFDPARLEFATQEQPLGTGHAVRVGVEGLDSDRVLILYGDTPLLEARDLAALVDTLDEDDNPELALLTCELRDATGYGRILRDAQGRVVEVREHRDLENEQQRAIREVNAGVYAARVDPLRWALDQLRPANAQGEYYLTDVVALAAQRGAVHARVGGAHNLAGVNDRAQLAAAETEMFRRIAKRHCQGGVNVRGEARIDDTVAIEPDASIEHGVVLRGQTRIGRGALIDVGCVVTDCTVGAAAVLGPYCVLAGAVVPPGSSLDPLQHRVER